MAREARSLGTYVLVNCDQGSFHIPKSQQFLPSVYLKNNLKYVNKGNSSLLDSTCYLLTFSHQVKWKCSLFPCFLCYFCCENIISSWCHWDCVVWEPVSLIFLLLWSVPSNGRLWGGWWENSPTCDAKASPSPPAGGLQLRLKNPPLLFQLRFRPKWYKW